jgi:hypothetical protein
MVHRASNTRSRFERILVFNNVQSQKNPCLYKNSAMALLFHGLDGWKAHELLHARLPERETYDGHMAISEKMTASLRRNSDGLLILKRE